MTEKLLISYQTKLGRSDNKLILARLYLERFNISANIIEVSQTKLKMLWSELINSSARSISKLAKESQRSDEASDAPRVTSL